MAGLDEYYRFMEKQDKAGAAVATPATNGIHKNGEASETKSAMPSVRVSETGPLEETGTVLSDGPPSWQRLPKHIALLARLAEEPGEEVAAKYYTRGFKESRQELIERLLDPTLTLEETARVLGVCPATVRRYTNRGVLPHYRTVGQQRRFRLSDVLMFLESNQHEGSVRGYTVRARTESAAEADLAA